MLFAYMRKAKTQSIRVPDQRLCFRYIDSTIPLLPKPLAIFSGCTPCLWRTWPETSKTSFLMTRLMYTDSLFDNKNADELINRVGLAQWLASRTTDQGVPGSRPGGVAVRCGLEQVTFIPLLSTG